MKKHLLALQKIVKSKNITQEQLGDKLDRGQGLISKKMSGKVPWQPREIPLIEKLTEGKITRYMLRPDIYGEQA